MTIMYLVTSRKSKYSAVIVATSHTDAKQYNDSVPGLGGVLTRLDLPHSKQPDYFLGMHTTSRAKDAIRSNNLEKGIY